MIPPCIVKPFGRAEEEEDGGRRLYVAAVVLSGIFVDCRRQRATTVAPEGGAETQKIFLPLPFGIKETALIGLSA